VAADGVVLGPALLSGSLPLLAPGLSRSAGGPLTGQRVTGASLLGVLAVLGAAPARLVDDVAQVFVGTQGITAAMRDGLLVYFGDSARPHAKWLSLATVLADPSSAGAAYVDVRVPERPAAGFAGAAAPQLDSAATEPNSQSDPTTAAELAAGLRAALGVESPGAQSAPGGEAATAATAATGATTAAPAEAAPGAPAPAGSTASREGPSAPASEPGTATRTAGE
jgi:hypothetical protein